MCLQMLFRFQVLTDNTNKLHFVCDSAEHLFVLYTKIFSVLYSKNFDFCSSFSCKSILSVWYWLVPSTCMYMPVQKKIIIIMVHVNWCIMTFGFFYFSFLCFNVPVMYVFSFSKLNFHDIMSNWIIFIFLTLQIYAKKHKGILNILVWTNI